jgi:hypothetical protein
MELKNMDEITFMYIYLSIDVRLTYEAPSLPYKPPSFPTYLPSRAMYIVKIMMYVYEVYIYTYLPSQIHLDIERHI